MLNNTLTLSNKCLFLDFFCIEYRWHKKHEPLPKDFFTENTIIKSIKTEFRQPELCFVDNKAFLSKDTSTETIEKLTAPNTSIIASVNSKDYESNYTESKIIRNTSATNNLSSGLSFANFKSVSPYHFSINKINEDESIDFNFPDRYFDTIQKGDTFCFYCKRIPRLDGEWFTWGTLLIMFVKNYGLLDKLELIPSDRVKRMINLENFHSKQTKLRDFRKSSLLFELG